MSNCSVEGCVKPVQGHGLCGTHYMRKRRTGSVDTVRPPGKPGRLRKHYMYGAWAGMVNRCHNSNNSSFNRYGALGIIVCERWRFGEDGKRGFECFLDDMGERPAKHTLDRIDPTGPYCATNCRWTTMKAQRANLSKVGERNSRIKGSKARQAYWRKHGAPLTPLGEAIRSLAEQKAESLSEVARRWGYSCSSFLTAVSMGHKKPSAHMLKCLADDGLSADLLDFSTPRAVGSKVR